MSSTTTTTTTMRHKWQPTLPPPPSSKILNLLQRIRQKQPRKAAAKAPFSGEFRGNYKARLDALSDQEQTFSRIVPIVLLNSSSGGDDDDKRRKRVEECGNGCGSVEEKWRFQAKILRAECNFLRMERDFALNKLERNRFHMERTLRSVV